MDDLRIPLRMLWKDWTFTLTALLTLALCIGANTALFSVVYGVLLRPFPVPHPQRILLLGNSYPGAGAPDLGNSGVPDYFDRLEAMTVFEEQALFRSRHQTVNEHGTPARVRVMQVTPSFFRLTGVGPALGRGFTDQEGEIGHERRAVLSYAFWQTEFGGAPGVVGRDLRIDGHPHTIVGVMPAGFSFLERDVRLWTPLAFTDEQKSDASRHSNNWQHIGRLKPGATLQQAQAQVDALNAANLERFPQYKELLLNAGFHTIVRGLQDAVVRDVKTILYLLWGGAVFVLLIGCGNVANLVLVRSRSRHRELATRLALGASRWRVARQLVTENVLLTLVSAVAGLAVGWTALRLLAAVNIEQLPRGDEIAVDGVVLAVTAGVALALGVVLGLIPALALLPSSVMAMLRDDNRTGTSGRGARAFRRALVVAQVASAFVLLIGAGLLLASFRQLLAVNPGFDGEGVLTASVSLPASRYADDAALNSFMDEALRRLRALPGARVAGATDTLPFDRSRSDSVILAEGHDMQPGESVISPIHVAVSPGYFEAMGVRLKAGRFFDGRDTAAAPRVVIVDERLANHFWPNRDPVGRRMYLPTDINDLLAVTEETVWLTVVGVIHDVKLSSLAEGRGAVGAYYFPLTQDASRGVTFAVRTDADPAGLATSVRSAISDLDRELPVFDVRTMEQVTEQSLVNQRSPVALSLSFGVVALFLSAIGIYGVLAYLVTQRTKEIGIRMALGSDARWIFGLVLREGLLLVGAGLAIGGIGAVGLRRMLETQLFGLRATDPGVLILATSVLVIVALAACAVPARRATRIDPVVALSE